MDKQKDICELLDKLTLDALDLIEQNVQAKVNLEKWTNEGLLLVAKARYISGHTSVGESQLPTENSTEFNALVHVNRGQDDLNMLTFDVNQSKVDKENGFIDPIHWFGVLVPQSLHLAKRRFDKAVEIALESANIQTRLLYVLNSIKSLKIMKIKIEE